MATVTPNGLINGFRGKFGNSLVFKTIRGKTFLSPAARKPSKKKETEAQRATRVTFKEASRWAKSTLLDPQKKEYYRQRAKALGLPNAYTAALTDYMRKPDVVKIQNRDTITYSITKKGFAMKNVSVSTEETSGPLLDVVIKQYRDLWVVHHKQDVENNSLLVLAMTSNNGSITFFRET